MCATTWMLLLRRMYPLVQPLELAQDSFLRRGVKERGGKYGRRVLGGDEGISLVEKVQHLREDHLALERDKERGWEREEGERVRAVAMQRKRAFR